MSLLDEVKEIKKKFKIVGREKELKLMLIAIKAGKHILLEGEVGVGKTFLARAIAEYFNSDFIRIDGSEDVLSHVLVGYFDPPTVISQGYKEDAFIYGPLSKAMMEGGCLFINELNRIPESTQNVLLSALDEGMLTIPKLKTIYAKEGFMTIATQNPSAHVGVSSLGEALKDRFIWIHIDYQTQEEEKEIVLQNLPNEKEELRDPITNISVTITRFTRVHPDIRRGASIRGTIDLAQIVYTYGVFNDREFWYDATIMALQPKIELMDGTNRSPNDILQEIVDKALDHF